MNIPLRLLGAACLAALATGAAQAALVTGTLTAEYYTVQNDPDLNQHKLSSLTVASQLGPTGLPVFVSSSEPVNDLTQPGREITWWSPSLNSHVVAAGSAIVAFPLVNLPMYAPRPGSSGPSPVNGLGFLTAHYSGSLLSAPQLQTYYLFLQSDDDAFVYIDGQIVAQVGGVHEFFNGQATPVAFDLTAGSHSLDIFYADREQTEAKLNVVISDSTAVTIPEPGALPLLALAIAGLAWRRGNRP